ncbi:DNA-binding transcriptional regulator, LysR family [Jannaschia faecimaris]|uniref:DNA-binding transcriptional regulator, LysR family n=1 Tax=Jannaschia faecimaris TaxID=1244108 RepID=A0A1H3NYJ9_9RHOB|nr:LysR family transcriptional regulator [Jannaschia faecimaris]SDY93967.1 DNA-binding transcriptional regulator, LysR family [Jannaschia faecimaris]
MTLDNWDDLKFVLAMTRHGTMSAAARYLDTNVATVSRRLDRLSHDLGVSLFEKRGTGFVATIVAERLALIAEDLDHTLRGEISSMIAGDKTTPIPIEIAAPPAVHKQFVLPRTGELSEYLPQVMLTLTDKVFSQGLGEADIQVRIGRPEGGRLKARKFCDYYLRVYHGKNIKMDGDWIGLTHRYPDADLLRDIYKEAKAQPRYRVEEMPMALDMVCETGLPGLLPDFMVQPHHNLVLADLPGNAVKGELWITYHETRHSDATLRGVVDWFCNSNGASPMAMASE